MRVNHPRRRAPRDNRGFTLLEILIALFIGLFLMVALLTIVQANRTVFGNQNQLSQMQDGERMAMTMIADVIQSAGYFPRSHHQYPDHLAHRRTAVRGRAGDQW